MIRCVAVTPLMKFLARKDADVLSENIGGKTINLNIDRDYLGVLGELVFREFLISNGLVDGKDFFYDAVVSGKFGDSCDFIVNGFSVDVKSSYRYYDLFVRDDVFLDKPCDFYVQVVVFGDSGVVVGFSDFSTVSKRRPRYFPILFNRVVLERFLFDIGLFFGRVGVLV